MHHRPRTGRKLRRRGAAAQLQRIMKNAFGVALAAAALASGLPGPWMLSRARRRRLPHLRQGHEREHAAPRCHGRRVVEGAVKGCDVDRSRRHLSRQSPGGYLSSQGRAHRLRAGERDVTLTAPSCAPVARPPAGARAAAGSDASRGGSLAVRTRARARRHATDRRRRRRRAAPHLGTAGRRPWAALRDARRADAGRAAAGLGSIRPNGEPKAAALLLPPGFSTEGPTQARRHHRQHGQPRSRHDERSPRGDRPRRVRSRDRRIRAGVRAGRPAARGRPPADGAGLGGAADAAGRGQVGRWAGRAAGWTGRTGRLRPRRARRPQNAYNVRTANYTFGGSALDSRSLSAAAQLSASRSSRTRDRTTAARSADR